jgi:hypothetical protein
VFLNRTESRINRIEMRRLHKGMAHRAERVVALVVGEEEDDVWAGRRFIGFGGVQRRQWREQRGDEERERTVHAGVW